MALVSQPVAGETSLAGPKLRGTVSTAWSALGPTRVSLPESCTVLAKPSLSLLWLQSSCAWREGDNAGGDPEPSTQAWCHRALQKWSGVRIDLRTGFCLLSVRFLPAWYLNPWAMLFEILHITNQRTLPHHRAQ